MDAAAVPPKTHRLGFRKLSEFLGLSHQIRPPVPHQLPYRADIDGLRGFAVVSVVLYHAFPRGLLSGGFVGVDVFFVISGFLISSLIYESLEKGRFSFTDFYARRVRRIIPALLIVLLCTFVAGWFVLPPWQFEKLGALIIGGSAFVPNLIIWSQTGYFDSAARFVPLLHLWSLGIEEQFYFLWPLIIVLFWRKRFSLVLGVIALLSFAANVALVHPHPSEDFYFPLTRFWELLAGAGLAWRERRHIKTSLGTETAVPHWLQQAMSVAGLLFLLRCVEHFEAAMPFPGWLAALPIAGTVMLIGAGPSTWLNSRLLAHPVTVFVGLISYPLYLWHWPIFSFLRIISVGEPAPWAMAMAIAAAVFLSWLTYRFVEKPIRSLQALSSRKLAVQLLLGGSLLTAALGVSVLAFDGVPDRYPPYVRVLASARWTPPASYRDRTCFLQPEQPVSDWKASCVDAAALSNTRLVVLWGDSHAAHLRAGLVSIQQKSPFRLAQMTASLCPPSLGLVIEDRSNCRDTNTFFMKQILALKPDTVILSALWRATDVRKTAPTIRALRAAHVPHVVLVGPFPFWRHDVPTLLIRSALERHSSPPDRLRDQLRDPLDEAAFRRFAREVGAQYVSPTAALCAGGSCQVMAGKEVIIWDNSHLTDVGSRIIAARLGPALTGE